MANITSSTARIGLLTLALASVMLVPLNGATQGAGDPGSNANPPAAAPEPAPAPVDLPQTFHVESKDVTVIDVGGFFTITFTTYHCGEGGKGCPGS